MHTHHQLPDINISSYSSQTLQFLILKQCQEYRKCLVVFDKGMYTLMIITNMSQPWKKKENQDLLYSWDQECPARSPCQSLGPQCGTIGRSQKPGEFRRKGRSHVSGERALSRQCGTSGYPSAAHFPGRGKEASFYWALLPRCAPATGPSQRANWSWTHTSKSVSQSKALLLWADHLKYLLQ